jgi:hypothetical protein
LIVSGAMLLSGCSGTPAQKSAELTAAQAALDTVDGIAGPIVASTAGPGWAAGLQDAVTLADNSMKAAVAAYNSGASDSAALAAAAEANIGAVIAILIEHGIVVPASAAISLSHAQGMHKAGLHPVYHPVLGAN